MGPVWRREFGCETWFVCEHNDEDLGTNKQQKKREKYIMRNFIFYISHICWDSLVNTVTRYMLEGQGLDPRCGKVVFQIHTRPDWLWGAQTLLYNWYWALYQR